MVLLFLAVAGISFYHVEQSISVVKYLLGHSVKDLLNYYALYHHSLNDFIFQTSSITQGNSPNGWKNVFYLFPLFVFSDLCGGLSLKTLYFFSISISLVFLGSFYWWVRRTWGKEAGFWAAFFLGFSAVFQEIARSGTYHTYSLLIAMIWILYCFYRIGSEKSSYFALLGSLTGLLWYMYSLARGLTLVAVARVLLAKAGSRKIAFGLFFGALLLVIVPGIIVLVAQHQNYQGPWHLLVIDRENIMDIERADIHRTFTRIYANVALFKDRLLGAEQVLDFPMQWKRHAHFLNFLLVGPMLWGMYTVLRSWREPKNKLLILISLMLFLVPMLTSAGGWNETRRAIFYVIPIYCFIGLGCSQIFERGRRIKSHAVKWLGGILLAVCVCLVVTSEALFVRQNIISFSRDMGLLSFVDNIKQAGICGKIYYLENRSIYNGSKESDIMRLALMEKGRSCIDLQRGSLKDRAPELSSFLLVRGPDISDDDFRVWIIKNQVVCDLDFYSPLTNLAEGKKNIWVQWHSSIFPRPFMLYEINKAVCSL